MTVDLNKFDTLNNREYKYGNTHDTYSTHIRVYTHTCRYDRYLNVRMLGYGLLCQL